MPKITYVDHAGTARTVEAETGATVMETAIRNQIPGIEAECGGACACATCHVIVEHEWADRLPPQGTMEAEMIDFVAGPTPTSRLSCQLTIAEAFDGLVLHLPHTQG